MVEIAVHDLHKYYGSNHVIKGISFEINKGEKVGLLGKNGSGKTTLFKVLSGSEEYEGGSIAKASGIKIEVLEQIPVFKDEFTVDDVLYSAFEEIFKISDEMRRLEALIKSGSTDELLTRYGKLQTEYEASGGYEVESRIDKICSGMNIESEMRSQLFSKLSGGEKTRVNLARILLRDSDILLLDEPTNHLDMPSLNWIEGFLENYMGTVFTISHDRCFLDNVVDRIIEIDDGKLSFYEGNYSFYVEEKEKRFYLQSEKYEQQQKKIGQLEAAAKRMHEWARNADNKAMHKRAFSIERRIERIDRIDKPAESKKITAEFRESSFSSDVIISLKGVGKSYGSKRLFHDVNLEVHRNDRIAIIGENGCGKSTLVKLLIGEEIPDEGDAVIGNSVKAAYMPQVIEFDDNEASILDTLRYILETNEEKARNILAAFHFRGKDVLKKTGMLSGGEKSRLKMCILMQGESNLLILDEPTNHLDIASREWVEDAVSQFKGTILFISHDRYFLNKFATGIWDMRNGEINDFQGTFNEYCEWRQKLSEASTRQYSAKIKSSANRSRSSCNKERDTADVKLKKSCEIENEIIEAENCLKSVCTDMDAAASDAGKLNQLYNEKVELERKLDSLYGMWSEINLA